MLTKNDNAGVLLNDENDTYHWEDSLDLPRAGLELTKPVDNKTRKTWETKFQSPPENNITRFLKLDIFIKGVIKRNLLDKDQELPSL